MKDKDMKLDGPLIASGWFGIPFVEISILTVALILDLLSSADMNLVYTFILLSLLGFPTLSFVSVRIFYVDIAFLSLGITGILILKYAGETASVGLGWITLLLLGLGTSGACSLIRRILVNVLIRSERATFFT